MSNKEQTEQKSTEATPESWWDKVTKHKDTISTVLPLIGGGSIIGIVSFIWYFFKVWWMLITNVILLSVIFILLVYLLYLWLSNSPENVDEPNAPKSFLKRIKENLYNNKKIYTITSTLLIIILSLVAIFCTYPKGLENSKKVNFLIGSYAGKRSSFDKDFNFSTWVKEIIEKNYNKDKILLSTKTSSEKIMEEATSEFAGILILETDRGEIEIHNFKKEIPTPETKSEIEKTITIKTNEKKLVDDKAKNEIKSALQRFFNISELGDFDSLSNPIWKIIDNANCKGKECNDTSCKEDYDTITSHIKSVKESKYKDCKEWKDFLSEVKKINKLEYHILNALFYKAMRMQVDSEEASKIGEFNSKIGGSLQEILTIRYDKKSYISKEKDMENIKEPAQKTKEESTKKTEEDLKMFSKDLYTFVFSEKDTSMQEDAKEDGIPNEPINEKNHDIVITKMKKSYAEKEENAKASESNKFFTTAEVKENYSLFIYAANIALVEKDKVYAEKAIERANLLTQKMKGLRKDDEAMIYIENKKIKEKIYTNWETLNKEFGINSKGSMKEFVETFNVNITEMNKLNQESKDKYRIIIQSSPTKPPKKIIESKKPVD